MGNLDFSEALKYLKNGNNIARKGWNGKGMFLFLDLGESVVISEENPLASIFAIGTPCKMLPNIMMKVCSEDLKLVPWVASQTDILAEDWCLL